MNLDLQTSNACGFTIIQASKLWKKQILPGKANKQTSAINIYVVEIQRLNWTFRNVPLLDCVKSSVIC